MPFKIHGVNYSISSACATSAHCIGNAVEQIQLGKQDIVFVAAAKSSCLAAARQFDAMGALSTQQRHPGKSLPYLRRSP
ncbi:beta-ketoacyl synthase N-terminal-like domain-containing protein [Escherichia coli]